MVLPTMAAVRAGESDPLVCLARQLYSKGLRPFPHTPFLACASLPPLRSGQVFLDEAEHLFHNEVPASLRSEDCSPSARNAVRVPFGITVRLRRNPQSRTSGPRMTKARANLLRAASLHRNGITGSGPAPLGVWKTRTIRISATEMTKILSWSCTPE